MECEDLARARVRIEVIDERRLFPGRDVREGQGLERRFQLGGKPLDVAFRLHLDVPDRHASVLGLAHADRFPVEEEQVIREPVPFLELELPHGNGRHRDIHVVAVLDGPASVLEEPVDLLPGSCLGGVLASGGWHYVGSADFRRPGPANERRGQAVLSTIAQVLAIGSDDRSKFLYAGRDRRGALISFDHTEPWQRSTETASERST